MSTGASIWDIVSLHPIDTQGQTKESTFVTTQDRQLPNLQAGFRVYNSDRGYAPPPSFFSSVVPQRLQQTHNSIGPQHYSYFQENEAWNLGSGAVLGLPLVHKIRVQSDGIPLQQNVDDLGVRNISKQGIVDLWPFFAPSSTGGNILPTDDENAHFNRMDEREENEHLAEHGDHRLPYRNYHGRHPPPGGGGGAARGRARGGGGGARGGARGRGARTPPPPGGAGAAPIGVHAGDPDEEEDEAKLGNEIDLDTLRDLSFTQRGARVGRRFAEALNALRRNPDVSINDFIQLTNNVGDNRLGASRLMLDLITQLDRRHKRVAESTANRQLLPFTADLTDLTLVFDVLQRFDRNWGPLGQTVIANLSYPGRVGDSTALIHDVPQHEVRNYLGQFMQAVYDLSIMLQYEASRVPRAMGAPPPHVGGGDDGQGSPPPSPSEQGGADARGTGLDENKADNSNDDDDDDDMDIGGLWGASGEQRQRSAEDIKAERDNKDEDEDVPMHSSNEENDNDDGDGGGGGGGQPPPPPPPSSSAGKRRSSRRNKGKRNDRFDPDPYNRGWAAFANFVSLESEEGVRLINEVSEKALPLVMDEANRLIKDSITGKVPSPEQVKEMMEAHDNLANLLNVGDVEAIVARKKAMHEQEVKMYEDSIEKRQREAEFSAESVREIEKVVNELPQWRKRYEDFIAELRENYSKTLSELQQQFPKRRDDDNQGGAGAAPTVFNEEQIRMIQRAEEAKRYYSDAKTNFDNGIGLVQKTEEDFKQLLQRVESTRNAIATLSTPEQLSSAFKSESNAAAAAHKKVLEDQLEQAKIDLGRLAIRYNAEVEAIRKDFTEANARIQTLGQGLQSSVQSLQRDSKDYGERLKKLEEEDIKDGGEIALLKAEIAELKKRDQFRETQQKANVEWLMTITKEFNTFRDEATTEVNSLIGRRGQERKMIEGIAANNVEAFRRIEAVQAFTQISHDLAGVLLNAFYSLSGRQTAHEQVTLQSAQQLKMISVMAHTALQGVQETNTRLLDYVAHNPEQEQGVRSYAQRQIEKAAYASSISLSSISNLSGIPVSELETKDVYEAAFRATARRVNEFSQQYTGKPIAALSPVEAREILVKGMNAVIDQRLAVMPEESREDFKRFANLCRTQTIEAFSGEHGRDFSNPVLMGEVIHHFITTINTAESAPDRVVNNAYSGVTDDNGRFMPVHHPVGGVAAAAITYPDFAASSHNQIYPSGASADPHHRSIPQPNFAQSIESDPANRINDDVYSTVNTVDEESIVGRQSMNASVHSFGSNIVGAPTTAVQSVVQGGPFRMDPIHGDVDMDDVKSVSSASSAQSNLSFMTSPSTISNSISLQEWRGLKTFIAEKTGIVGGDIKFDGAGVGSIFSALGRDNYLAAMDSLHQQGIVLPKYVKVTKQKLARPSSRQ